MAQSVDDPRALTALHVGAAVFDLEKLAHQRSVDECVLPSYGAVATGLDLVALAECLREVVLFVLAEDVSIEFENRAYQADLAEAELGATQICLFSGGIDSFVGVQAANAVDPATEAVFCAHRDQARLIAIAEKLAGARLRGVPLAVVPVPPMGSQGYMQLRGFLYVLAAGMRLAVTGASRLVVTECGPTMFQPSFSPLDATTMTTHPEVLRLANLALNLILGRRIRILTPFADRTKAEVIALCPRTVPITSTHSCISQRFGDHDGTCYGCVVRRLAAVAAGRRDVSYRKDPLRDSAAAAGNLLTLLDFCCDILSRFDRMPEFSTGLIKRYRKRDLFRRFALDNFAAVHRLIGNGARLREDVRDLYDRACSSVGAAALEERLKLLALGEGKPDWTADVTV